MASPPTPELAGRCEQLRALHRPGDPVLLPNAWDAATAKAVVAAGFPAVATTSWGVAATLGYEDDEGAPGDEMFWLATRIVRAVDAPVTVDAEAGYGLEPAALVAALRDAGAAGCNLEDTDHRAGRLRDSGEHAAWLAAVRKACSEIDYPLVINARVDTYLQGYIDQVGPGTQAALVADALERATAYRDAGADCVYPICLWEPDALRTFMAEFQGNVNLARVPEAPGLTELGALGVARVSWAIFLHVDAMARFTQQLEALRN